MRGKNVALDGGPPSFSTTLSEGDKRTLAFAFFVASTLNDPKLPSRIVVIDDPMCSLDLNRKQYTKSLLRKLHSKAHQLVLLAHDPYFIRDVRDALRKDDTLSPIASLQLVMTADGYSNFSSFDVDRDCESPYFLHHRLLNDFVGGRQVDVMSVAKAMRPMLEGYLHRRFPGLVPKSQMFGQVVAQIREALPPSPLCHAQNLVDRLNEINDYAGQFHHDATDAVTPNPAELRTWVLASLNLVHKSAP